MTKDDSPVPDEFRVNQATIDYLKLHIESEVRDRLLKWIGLPFGGAGLLAVVIGPRVPEPPGPSDGNVFERNVSESLSIRVRGKDSEKLIRSGFWCLTIFFYGISLSKESKA